MTRVSPVLQRADACSAILGSTRVARSAGSNASEADVHVLAGEEAERRIDAGGKHHGLIGRIFRMVHSLGEEGEHTRRHIDELQAGHYVVIVPVTDDRAPDRIGDILSAHGGHFIYYYTRLTSRELVP